MKVLVLGATGYIGGAVVERLVEQGHEVAAVVRQAADGSRRLPAVQDERYGDLSDAASIAAAVTPDIDAILHTAQLTGDEAKDLEVIGALVGSGKPVTYVSGVWVLGATEDGHEGSEPNPIPIVGYRPKVERLVTDGGGRVVRPGLVHGRGGGIPALLLGKAAERGVGVYVGDEAPVATFVHVDDLAELIVTVVEKGEAGSVYHGIAEEGVSLAEVATAAAKTAGARAAAEPWPVADAAQQLGQGFAEALALSQRVSSARTREALGWLPSRPGVVSELLEGSYTR